MGGIPIEISEEIIARILDEFLRKNQELISGAIPGGILAEKA